MSGAFNIDIEVGPADGGKKIKIYCASLTDTWNAEHDQIQLAQFHAALSKEDAVLKSDIKLGQCPKTDNINGCELFLSRLGCAAAILRLALFHKFLDIPKPVREGLLYASHKAYGKTIREGYMQKHPRFIRSGGGRRWIRFTRDERGGSLIVYPDENTNTIISSLKIGASTEIQNLRDKGIPNAFVLKSGKRQWILQGSSSRDYTAWQSQLVAMLKDFGPVTLQANNSNTSPKQSAAKPSTNAARSGGRAQTAQTSANAGKLLGQNKELTAQVKKLEQKIKELEFDIDRYTDLEIEMKTSETELRRKGLKKAEKEKEELIAHYEVKQDNLRQEIEEMHRKLEQKTADEGGRSGLKTLFGEDYLIVDMNDYKAGGGKGNTDVNEMLDDEDSEEEDEDEGGDMRTATANYFDEDDEEAELNSGGGHFKYLHKHMHYHDHKHFHDHRHTHIHDQTGDKAVTYTQTHTTAHTITHTMTQFKIKKLTFGAAL
eukprot:11880_1